jgi:hypothetical protein
MATSTENDLLRRLMGFSTIGPYDAGYKIMNEVSMMQRRVVFSSTSLGWPERILGGIFLALVLLLGFTFGLVLLGLGVAAGLILAARLWWLRRRLLRDAKHQEVDIIEGEYRILTRRTEDRDNDKEI